MDANLYLKKEKCKFYTTSTIFLGFVLELGKLQVNLEKLKSIGKWLEPTNIIEI